MSGMLSSGGCMRMKLALILVVFSAGLSEAYIRAPYYSEKSFSGRMGSQNAVQNIVLSKETMLVHLPRLDMKTFNPYTYNKKIRFKASYYLFNKRNSYNNIDLEFLAIHISPAIIRINNKKTIHTIVESKKARQRFISRMIKNRHNWNNDKVKHRFYKYDNSSFQAGYSDKEFDLFQAGIVSSKPHIIRFRAGLKPGMNIITVEYYQNLFVDEVFPKRKGFHFSRARFGFDYLLHPGVSWKKESGYRSSITIVAPDISGEDKSYPVNYQSNIAFTKSRDERSGISHLKAKLKSFPVHIFTFLYSIDKRDDE